MIVYCAGGVRSLLAARTLKDMGYDEVFSMAEGFNVWKDRGLPFTKDFELSTSQLERIAATSRFRKWEKRDRASFSSPRFFFSGRAVWAPPPLYTWRRPELGPWASWTSTLWTAAISSARFFTATRMSACPRRSPPADDQRPEPGRQCGDLSGTPFVREHHGKSSRAYDLIVDGCDNFPTRYLVNDACVFQGKPNVHGSIFQFEGQVTVFDTQSGGPCYRCLYPAPPPPGNGPSCAEAGVSASCGDRGGSSGHRDHQDHPGKGVNPWVGRLILYDALATKFREMKLRRDPGCPVCGDNPEITGLIDYDQFCAGVPAAG